MSVLKIVFIGAGNIASNLSEVFKKKLSAEIHIFSRTENSAKQLAEKLNVSFSNDFNKIPDEADIYFLSVSDNALNEIVNNQLLKKKINNQLVVHSAGAIDIEILKPLSANYGVFYPLQTFSKFKSLDFKFIPICIEANSGFNYNTLSKYAFQLSDDVRKISSEQRKYIHLAAVFANNFVNHMFTISENILKEKEIDFKILFPLIQETIENLKNSSPKLLQTGPAVRNDMNVISEHLKMLGANENLIKIYTLISQDIKETKDE